MMLQIYECEDLQEQPLIPSGLLGPVTIQMTKKVEVNFL